MSTLTNGRTSTTSRVTTLVGYEKAQCHETEADTSRSSSSEPEAATCALPFACAMFLRLLLVLRIQQF
eukprot:m.294450 g.294450  ORF g.294450 m.294450 type:complete len:68 (-) comp240297_c0_seq1:47-250(-)